MIRDFLNPDFYLVGQFDDRSGETLEAVNRRVCLKDPVVRRMSIENAEISKIAINSYITLKISFANTIADLCERVPGGDVDVVSDALGSDSRIGRKYLSGGMGFAGPCFPRDNVALSFIGSHLGANCSLLETNDSYNHSLSDRFVEKLKRSWVLPIRWLCSGWPTSRSRILSRTRRASILPARWPTRDTA